MLAGRAASSRQAMCQTLSAAASCLCTLVILLLSIYGAMAHPVQAGDLSESSLQGGALHVHSCCIHPEAPAAGARATAGQLARLGICVTWTADQRDALHPVSMMYIRRFARRLDGGSHASARDSCQHAHLFGAACRPASGLSSCPADVSCFARLHVPSRLQLHRSLAYPLGQSSDCC